MAIKFRDGKVTVVNYGAPLSEEDINTIKQNYAVTEVDQINYRCKGFSESQKPWYLQCVDWVKLIPESLMRDGNYVLRLPDKLPKEICIYMVMECYSRSGKIPKIVENRESALHRIIDLDYEVSFSRSKRRDQARPE